MIIANGRTIAQKILSQIKTGLKGRSVSLPRRQAGVATIWVGENLAIGRFIEMKKKSAESIGIKIKGFHFSSNESEEKIVNKIKELSEDKKVNGIIVELPLPEKFNKNKILNSIPENKDIDMLSEVAQENFYNNRTELLPPSVGALKILFEEYKINPKNKVAAVFGQSILVGKPISHWLENQGARVFRIDENTENTRELCLRADIVVSGVGKPNLINGNMVKRGVVIVDFGFVPIFHPRPKGRDRKIEGPRFDNRASRESNREKIKISGDVDFDSVAPKTSLITPVPGGMGPIVIASFLENALKLYLASTR